MISRDLNNPGMSASSSSRKRSDRSEGAHTSSYVRIRGDQSIAQKRLRTAGKRYTSVIETLMGTYEDDDSDVVIDAQDQVPEESVMASIIASLSQIKPPPHDVQPEAVLPPPIPAMSRMPPAPVPLDGGDELDDAPLTQSSIGQSSFAQSSLPHSSFVQAPPPAAAKERVGTFRTNRGSKKNPAVASRVATPAQS